MVSRSAWLIVKWMSGTGMQECFGKKDLVIAFVLQTQRAEGERSGWAQGLWWRQGACEGEMKGKECERGTGATAALTLGMEDRADRGLWAGDGEPGTNSRLQPEKGTFIFIWCLSDGLQAGCGTESIAHAHQLWYVRFSPARQWCCQGSLPLTQPLQVSGTLQWLTVQDLTVLRRAFPAGRLNSAQSVTHMDSTMEWCSWVISCMTATFV